MIKIIAVHIKGYIKESVLTPLFMILEVVMETIIPLLMATMIDNGISKCNMEHIIITGLLMLLCALVALFAGAMGGVFGAKASAGFAARIGERKHHDPSVRRPHARAGAADSRRSDEDPRHDWHRL